MIETGFEDMSNITPASEDYIKAIMIIQQRQRTVGVKDIAHLLHVKKPSVVAAIRTLVEKGLVNHEHYGKVSLTQKGERVARHIQETHRIIFQFLHFHLGIEAERADEEACKIEHHLSGTSILRLRKLSAFLETLPVHRHRELENMLNKTNITREAARHEEKLKR